MKKLFAILAVMGVLTLGSVQPVMAQDAAPAQTEQTTEAAVVEEGGGLHKELKTKFIEGDASFMSLVAIALVLGLAFCIERIIYLSLAETNTKKLMANIEAALEKGDVEAAKTVCRNTRGPVASICYQGLMRIDEGIDVVERSVVSYGGVQAGYLEKGCSWITLFIAMAPVPFRGKRNESSYIKNVAMKLAEIYGLDFKDVDRITANNALKVFKMAE
jgi:biopolymer transport protein ExbB